MTSLSPAEALQALLEGNRRFASGQVLHPDEDAHYRAQLAAGQHPIAAILGCADSRVPPQLIFDQGFGRLFTTRVAGHIAGETVVASLDYAVQNLGVPLIFVKGHTGCGAVAAALRNFELGQCNDVISRAICPAIQRAEQREGDILENAVYENVVHVTRYLQEHPAFATAQASGKLKIIGGVYELGSGIIRLISDESEDI